MDTEQFARDAIGQMFAPDEIPETETDWCYAYPDGYGKPADTAEAIDELSDEGPAYPTTSVLLVELEQTSEGEYEVVRAKVHDTSTPQDNTNWVDKEESTDD